ncbi:MAG: FAD synthetase family protein [Treponema sp.]|jgi:riboflavin kinase/FMN adenylyltransferase|nr:FAD synthetase family protein [Treponema sp.]
MRIINWNDFITQNNSQKNGRAGIAVTVGVFDGVHLGHQALIKKITVTKEDFVPTVFTFLENPKSIMKPESFCGNIITLKQKLEIFESFNIEQVVLIDFSGNFSKLGGREFIDLLRIRGNLRYLVVGSNFRCGHKLDTNAALMKEQLNEHGVLTDAVEPVTVGNEFISSSRIRAAILSGDLVEARALFGRNFKIDVSDISKTPGSDEIIFNAAGFHQITPPNGRYPVLLYEMNSNEGIETEAVIADGNIILPSQFNADSIEFICNA